tara:strand:- start:568 stop:1128 length:561 start_codon:yes stop_codon:yes gene_type:complete
MSRKIVHGVRHGEAWHNILFQRLGTTAYTDFADSTLTVQGMKQAVGRRNQVKPDIVYVSPLTRTLQTATLMFPGIPTIALECLKEYPQHTEIINRRSNKSDLETLFPQVDFSQIKFEEDHLFESGPPLQILESCCCRAQEIVQASSAQRIALVTHSSWLKYFMHGHLDNIEEELEHCTPYLLTNNK